VLRNRGLYRRIYGESGVASASASAAPAAASR
jgi:hypothetical protein